MGNYIENIKTQFKNVILNAVGVDRDLYELIRDKDISKAISLMDDNDIEVDKAIREYNPQTHEVMKRRDKDRKGKNPYVSEKLPRSRQRYINEVELFFLLGKPIIWKKKKGDDELYEMFINFLDKKMRFNALMRKAKRLAGAETESAIIFNITSNVANGEDGLKEQPYNIKPFVAARSLGYKLRPMFDQYGDLIALAYGYTTKSTTAKPIEHWDILTADYTFLCTRDTMGWDVKDYPNPTGKINAVYFKQPKAWDNAVPRIHREEMLDSRAADTNNYFADPIASATADVIEGLSEPDTPGKMIRLTGDKSRFEYIAPPQGSGPRNDEKADLHNSILFDTFTPDLSYASIKGLGSLSGAALHNALILGYIKRDSRIEVYGEMVDRLRSVIIAILKMVHPDKEEDFDRLDITFEFGEPFDSDKREKWNSIATLYKSGLMSLETAVQEIAIVADTDSEIERIRMQQAEQLQAQQEAAEKMQAVKSPDGIDPNDIKREQQEKEALENEEIEKE